jgi:tRNA 2-thiouridine synthesizing protein E
LLFIKLQLASNSGSTSLTHFIQENPMTLCAFHVQDTDSSSQYVEIRFVELADQHWDRSKSVELAKSEGICLKDEHWAVIIYLRRYYLQYGVPRDVQTLVEALNRQFSVLGGDQYLQRLFPGGPVRQGSRLANLRMPAIASDDVLGNRY